METMLHLGTSQDENYLSRTFLILLDLVDLEDRQEMRGPIIAPLGMTPPSKV